MVSLGLWMSYRCIVARSCRSLVMSHILQFRQEATSLVMFSIWTWKYVVNKHKSFLLWLHHSPQLKQQEKVSSFQYKQAWKLIPYNYHFHSFYSMPLSWAPEHVFFLQHQIFSWGTSNTRRTTKSNSSTQNYFLIQKNSQEWFCLFLHTHTKKQTNKKNKPPWNR